MEKQQLWYTGRRRSSRSSNMTSAARVPSGGKSRGDPTQHTRLSQHMRSTSSLQRRKTVELPPRAQSSLGFTWNSRKSCQPQGFDIAGYMKRHGSAAEIRIGRNGQITNDEYLTSYLRECRKQVQVEEEGIISDSDSETESADIFDGIDLQQIMNPRNSREKRVPLCWQDQLQMAKIPTRTASIAYGKPEHTRKEEHELNDTSVMFSWRDMCLSRWTTVGHLKESQFVPRFGLDKENPSDTLTTELLPRLLQSDIGCNNMLCIWLEIEGSIQKKLTFDVFVTDTSSEVQPSTKAFTQLKAKVISDTVVVLPLSLTQPSLVQSCHSVCEWSGKEVAIAVVLCKPRSMLFSVKIKLGMPDFLGIGVFDEQGAEFFKRRSSYCSEKDDEDRTDIRAITLEFPDLQVLDCDDDSPPPSPASVHHPTTGRNKPLYRPPSRNTGYTSVVKTWLEPYLHSSVKT